MKPSDNKDNETQLVENLKNELAKVEPTKGRRIREKFILAILGSIPWVGGFLSAAASYKAEEGTIRQDGIQTEWLKEHEKKILLLKETISDVEHRFENLGPAIDERIQDESYLSLVRKAFRTWDRADTDEKRKYVANIVSNSAGTRICSDDVIRLFIDWIEIYHEAHFAVIREIYKNPGSPRYDIWSEIYGALPREDSAEADLFKLLIRDLSTGGVIRQERETNNQGQFLRRRQAKSRGPAPTTVETAFEGTKPYVLTEIGKQFVHYTMNEVVARIDS